jgi:hypothetical protein
MNLCHPFTRAAVVYFSARDSWACIAGRRYQLRGVPKVPGALRIQSSLSKVLASPTRVQSQVMRSAAPSGVIMKQQRRPAEGMTAAPLLPHISSPSRQAMISNKESSHASAP